MAPVVLVITQTRERLRIRREFGERVEEVEYPLAGLNGMTPPREKTVVRWEGAKLIIEGPQALKNGNTVSKVDIIQLEAEDRLSIESTIQATSRFERKEVFVRQRKR